MYRFSSLSFRRAIIRSWNPVWVSLARTKRCDKSRISTAFRPFRRSISGNDGMKRCGGMRGGADVTTLHSSRVSKVVFSPSYFCFTTLWSLRPRESWKGDSFLQEAPNLICTLLRLPRLNSLRYIAQTITLQKFMTFTRFCIHLSLFVFEENYNPSRCIRNCVGGNCAKKCTPQLFFFNFSN